MQLRQQICDYESWISHEHLSRRDEALNHGRGVGLRLPILLRIIHLGFRNLVLAADDGCTLRHCPEKSLELPVNHQIGYELPQNSKMKHLRPKAPIGEGKRDVSVQIIGSARIVSSPA
jgi:hypothetical protein